MYARVRTHACPVGDLDMACQGRGICHYDIAAELAIVRDVRLRHKQIVVTDASHAAAARRPAMYRHKFADLVSLAYLDRCRLALVFEVLRRKSYRHERKYPRFAADRGSAVNYDMRI
jgi:hypothetical protein